jgi:hypothetical protein
MNHYGSPTPLPLFPLLSTEYAMKDDWTQSHAVSVTCANRRHRQPRGRTASAYYHLERATVLISTVEVKSTFSPAYGAKSEREPGYCYLSDFLDLV